MSAGKNARRVRFAAGGEIYDTMALRCAACGFVAIVPLTPRLRAKQPDDTTHVCHPAIGGCNLGYSCLSAREVTS